MDTIWRKRAPYAMNWIQFIRKVTAKAARLKPNNTKANQSYKNKIIYFPGKVASNECLDVSL